MLQNEKNSRASSTEMTYTDINQILEEHRIVEEKLLGTLITNPHRIPEVTQIITSNQFYLSHHRNLFEAICDLYSKNKKIDPVNLIPIIKASQLVPFMEHAGIGIETKILSIKVKENSVVRSIYDMSQASIQSIHLHKPIKDIIILLNDMIAENHLNLTEKDNNNTIDTIITELNQERELIHERKMIGFPTWDSLDQMVYGLIIPHIWIIGGYSGTGKTFFMLQLAERILRNNANIVIFSTENSRMRNVLRLIGCHTGIIEMKILKNELSDDDNEAIQNTEKYLISKNIFVFDDIFTTSDIRLKLSSLKDKNVNVVMIDYIQLLNIQEDGYEQMRMVAAELQRIAKEFNCAIVAISQISNEGQRSKSFFRMSFKGAGEIGAIADVAIELKRAENDFSTLGLIVKKVRHGIPGTLQFKMFTSDNITNKNYIGETI